MINKITFRQIGYIILLLKAIIVIYFLLKIIVFRESNNVLELNENFLLFIVAGFFAQFIDGALGMAYGVSCTTLLLNFGIPPSVATASVHTAEVFTTGASGLSHLYMKNVNKELFFKLTIPGVIGAMVGAYLISDIFDGNVIKPFISGYLLIMGLIILIKSFKKLKPERPIKRVGLLGFVGAFCDAIGGGGWGPIVTSNLILKGKSPKEVIGTVNTAEFFIAFFGTGVFLFFVGIDSWQVILGLIIGGLLAAPLSAIVANRINAKMLMRIVGVIITVISVYSIYKALK